jgi:hypothetical protein
MMRDDRERLGLSVARASWLLGVSVRRYRDLEDGEAYQSYGEWSRTVEGFEVAETLRVSTCLFEPWLACQPTST